MTRQDLVRIYNLVQHCKVGYCIQYSSGKCEYDLVELGFNHGIYGWNWTAFFDPDTDTLYVSCYRNVPYCIKEK